MTKRFLIDLLRIKKHFLWRYHLPPHNNIDQNKWEANEWSEQNRRMQTKKPVHLEKKEKISWRINAKKKMGFDLPVVYHFLSGEQLAGRKNQLVLARVLLEVSASCDAMYHFQMSTHHNIMYFFITIKIFLLCII